MKRLPIAILCAALLAASVPAAAFDDAAQGARAIAVRALSAKFGSGASIRFDDRGGLTISGVVNAPAFRAVPDYHSGSAAVVRPDLKKASAAVFTAIRESLWAKRNFALLETKVESSNYGNVAFSTLQLDGFPVVDHLVRVDARPDGSVSSVRVTLPSDATGLKVSTAMPRVTLQTAARTICEHARTHFNGLVCAPQAQRVWFRTEDGVLAPAARMLLKSADMGSLREAIVDLRTGELVRFADLARR